MPGLNIKLLDGIEIHPDGDACWPDLQIRPYKMGEFVAVAALGRGMETGRPSIMMRIELEDGSVVLAQTSLRLFSAATRAFVARYGDPHSDELPETH